MPSQSLIDAWFDTPTDETLTEFVSVRTTMDEVACQSAYQMWLEHEADESMRRAEEEMRLVVEKQQGVEFESLTRLPDYGAYRVPSNGTVFFNGQPLYFGQQNSLQNLQHQLGQQQGNQLQRGLLGGIGGFFG